MSLNLNHSAPGSYPTTKRSARSPKTLQWLAALAHPIVLRRETSESHFPMARFSWAVMSSWTRRSRYLPKCKQRKIVLREDSNGPLALVARRALARLLRRKRVGWLLRRVPDSSTQLSSLSIPHFFAKSFEDFQTTARLAVSVSSPSLARAARLRSSSKRTSAGAGEGSGEDVSVTPSNVKPIHRSTHLSIPHIHADDSTSPRVSASRADGAIEPPVPTFLESVVELFVDKQKPTVEDDERSRANKKRIVERCEASGHDLYDVWMSGAFEPRPVLWQIQTVALRSADRPVAGTARVKVDEG